MIHSCDLNALINWCCCENYSSYVTDGRNDRLIQCNSSTPNFPNWDQIYKYFTFTHLMCELPIILARKM